MASTAFLSAATPTRSPQRPLGSGPLNAALLAERVRTEFLHAWTNYDRLASDHDELNPVSRTPHDWYPPAILYMTAVDALDTMFLMHLNTEAGRVQSRML